MAQMEIISIKIEQTYFSISHEQREGGVCRVLASQRVYLPEDLLGKNGRAKPNKLAKFIYDAIDGAGIETKNVALYLGAKIAFFAHFEYEAGSNNSARLKRRKAEEDRLFSNLDEKPMTAFYDYASEYEGAENGAILAADGNYIKILLNAFDYYGYKVVLVSSTLICYAETMKPVAKGAGRVVAIDINKTGLIVACFERGEPVLLAAREFAEPIANAQMLNYEVAKIIDLTVPKTRVVLTGFRSGEQGFFSAIASSAGVIYCKPLSFELKGAGKTIAFQGRLAGREAMLPGVFTAIGADPTSPSVANFIQKKESPQSNKGLIALCVATLVVAFGVALAPMVNNFLVQRAHDRNVALLTSGDNAVMYEKIMERRDLTTKFAELNTSFAMIPGKKLSYISLVEELKIALLMGADIQKITFTEGGGVLIDFVTSDAENFDEMKTVIESGGRMAITETIDRVETKEGRKTLTQIQIKVLAGNELQ